MLIAREAEALDRLAGGWRRLAEEDARIPTGSFAWARACAETLVPNGRLHVVATGPPERPRAIAPLVRSRSPLGRLELLGVRQLYEPTDLLGDGSALEELAAGLAGAGEHLYLRRLPEGSRAVAAVRAAYAGRGTVTVRACAPMPAVELDGVEEPESILSSRRRSDLRRARRRSEKRGEVAAEVHAPGPAEVGPLLEEAFRVEAASWKGRDGTALALDPVRGGFVRRYAAAAAREGTLRLCFLRIGGEAAAMQIAVESGGAFWLLKIGYDESFARASPGSLLMLETLRYAAGRGLRSYELLGAAEPWTRAWSTVERGCVDLRAYPLRPRALAARLVDAGESAARRTLLAWRRRRG